MTEIEVIERRKPVATIETFNVYVDRQTEELDGQFRGFLSSQSNIGDLVALLESIRLGSWEREATAKTVLSYSFELGRLVGVPLDRLLSKKHTEGGIPGDDKYHILAGSNGNLSDLVGFGYLRLGMHLNQVVVYPTKMLLDLLPSSVSIER